MKLTTTNVVILAVIGWIGYQTVNGQPIVPALPDLSPSGGDPTPAPAVDSFPLGRGSRGKYVRALQKHLGIKVDGVFGQQTENALSARHGKPTVDSLAELTGWLGNAQVATAPTSPTAAPVSRPAASTASSAYGTFPLKLNSRGQYVRNLQQWLGLKIDGIFGAGTLSALKKRTGQSQIDSLEQLNYLLGNAGAPAAGAPAATKPAATTVKPNWAELDRVFRAFWTPLPGSPNVVRLNLIADRDTLHTVLDGKTDAQLQAFIVQYNSAYKNWKGVNNTRKLPTLAGDFSQLTIVGGSSVALLRDRIARLSIKR